MLVGPSGSGKGTVLKEVLAEEKCTFLSVSATTRKPRPGEEHGRHYFFLEEQEFLDLIDQEGLLEYANYCGNYYGTPKQAVLDRLDKGENVILEIEVQGARNVRKMYPEAVMVFILPPSMEVLQKRLTGRGTEDAETVARRLAVARQELPFAKECDYCVVNDTVEEAAASLRAIIRAQGCRQSAMNEFVEGLIRE